MSLLDPRLQAFVSVIRNQTVHGASKELGLTQTAVTQRIRALESDNFEPLCLSALEEE